VGHRPGQLFQEHIHNLLGKNMKTGIILINPIPLSGVKRWLLRQEALDLPLNLLAISAPLVKSGYRVKIIDQRAEPGWEGILLEELKQGPVCVGINCMGTHLISSALEASRIVKKNSDIPVVWGGQHPTILPEQTVWNEHIDIVVKGDGEETFLELVNAISNGSPFDKIKGIYYKQGGSIRANLPRAPFDLNNSSPLPYHLVDMKKYTIRGPGYRIINFISSRGCTSKCSFCYHPGHESSWRALSARETINNVERLNKEYGFNGIVFRDPNFFADTERGKAILEGLIEKKLNAPFHTMQIKANTLFGFSDDTLKLLEKSGFCALGIGVESGSQKILKLLNKDIEIPQIISINQRMSRFNINLRYNFMLGIPEETEDDLHQTVELYLKLIRENKRATCIFTFYNPIYGTELFNLLVKHKLKVPQSLEEWGCVSDGYKKLSKNRPWVDSHRRLLLTNLYLCAMVGVFSARSKAFLFTNNSFWLVYSFQLIAKLYSPFAKKRMKSFNFKFFIEKYIVKYIIGIN